MSDTPTPAGLLELDQVSTETFAYGVKVADLGEDSDTMIAFTDDWKRAIAAMNVHGRWAFGRGWTLINLVPSWRQVFGRCGCGESCQCEDPESYHDCEMAQLPPCGDEYAWMAAECKEGEPGAIAVFVGEVA